MNELRNWSNSSEGKSDLPASAGQTDNKKYRAAIITVGGTEEPIQKTIIENTPEFVVFLASNESIATAGKVVDGCKREDVRPEFEYIIVEDEANLVDCYKRSLEAIDKVKKRGYAAKEVLIDFTGGTKAMSVGLGLAAVREDFDFSYVSGRERTKDGVGVVISGTEEILISTSPWQLFAIEEKKALAVMFNKHQFLAASELVERLANRKNLPSYEQSLMGMLKELINGYLQWDHFKHPEARKSIDRHKVEAFEKFVNDHAGHDDRAAKAVEQLGPFVEAVKNNCRFLERLQERTKGFKDGILVEEHVVDLLANAHRRYEEGKYDDAFARLYRAVEMAGQIAFTRRFGYQTKEVPPEIIPATGAGRSENLREEFVRKYADEKTGMLKLPLTATYTVLSAVGDELGKRFDEHRETVQKFLHIRNNSILAHGIKPVKKEHYEEYQPFAMSLIGVKDDDLPQFPKLPLRFME